jgi:hypothetical protein
LAILIKNSFLGEFFIIKKQEFVAEYNFFSIYFSQYDEKLPPKTRKKKRKKQLNCIFLPLPLSFGE